MRRVADAMDTATEQEAVPRAAGSGCACCQSARLAHAVHQAIMDMAPVQFGSFARTHAAVSAEAGVHAYKLALRRVAEPEHQAGPSLAGWCQCDAGHRSLQRSACCAVLQALPRRAPASLETGSQASWHWHMTHCRNRWPEAGMCRRAAQLAGGRLQSLHTRPAARQA